MIGLIISVTMRLSLTSVTVGLSLITVEVGDSKEHKSCQHIEH